MLGRRSRLLIEEVPRAASQCGRPFDGKTPQSHGSPALTEDTDISAILLELGKTLVTQFAKPVTQFARDRKSVV